MQERGGKTGTMLEVRKMRMIHPYWDMTLLEVESLDLTIGTLDSRPKTPAAWRAGSCLTPWCRSDVSEQCWLLDQAARSVR